MSSCIVCLKIGDKYSSDYVNNLYYMTRRYTDLPFICFTNDPYGILPEIERHAILPYACEKYWPAWNKIELFGRKELEKYEKKIFFDLDVIIHDNIDPILNHEDNFSVIHSKWKENMFTLTVYNSSVMVWKDNTKIYEDWKANRDFFIMKYKGIDKYFSLEKVPLTYVPPIVYSYRLGTKLSDRYLLDDERNIIDFNPNYSDGVFEIQPNHSIAIFHGEPNIHDLKKDEHEILKYWGK